VVDLGSKGSNGANPRVYLAAAEIVAYLGSAIYRRLGAGGKRIKKYPRRPCSFPAGIRTGSINFAHLCHTNPRSASEL
jgi:hypothetical protein